MLEQNLTQLIEDLRLPFFPSKDQDGYFQIVLSENLSIALRPLFPGFLVVGKLAPMPTEKKEELFSYLMKANLLGQGTGNQLLGADIEEKFLTLSRTISYEVNYTKFKEILEEFVNYFVYWKGEIQKKGFKL